MLIVKASKEKFEEFGQTITTERQLKDGDYIKHFELCVPDSEKFFMLIRPKTSIEIYDEETLLPILALEEEGI